MDFNFVRFCWIVFAVGVLLGGVGVHFIERAVVRDVAKTEYIKGETIHVTVPVPPPVSEERPDVATLPVLRDTVYIDNIIYVREKVDTAAIIADYELHRKYEVPLFDNKYGKLDVSVSTQYNKVGSVSYSFVPIETVRTVYAKRTWQPFAGASYSTLFDVVGVGGGMFYHSLGLSYEYQYSLRERVSGHRFELAWKF